MDSVAQTAGADAGLRKSRRPAQGDLDRLPPFSEEAEQGLLGCVLQAPMRCLAQLEEGRFSGEAFYDLRHQTIYAAFQKLYGLKHETMEMQALLQTLKEMQMLEEVGGFPYLNTLQDAVGSPEMLGFYQKTVVDKWKLRKLIGFAGEVMNRAVIHQGDAGVLLDAVANDFLKLSEPLAERTESHIKDVLRDKVLVELERHYNRGSTQLDGLPTGKDWYLDKVLLGIAPTDYVILAGRPGEGKTSLALNVVDYLASDYEWSETQPDTGKELEGWSLNAEEKVWFRKRKGIPVGIFTLEMTEDSLAARMVFGRAQVSRGTFRQGFASKDAWNKVNKAFTELCAANIYLDGEPDQTIDQIAAKARRWARQYGIKLFVLDYLQLLDGDDERDHDRVRALRKISKKIVALKKRLGIPWLVLAQMNRNIETAERARRPVMSDLKESGSLEQDADKIVILYHPLKGEGIEEDEELIEQVLTQNGRTAVKWDAIPRRINALVVKNRNGPTGVAQLLFQNNQCLFQDYRQWKVANNVEEAAQGERQPALDRTIAEEDMP